MVNSIEKGKSGERELANKLKEYGYECRRGQQFCGGNGDADVVGLEGMHLEVKRTERLSLYDALAQAKADAREGEMPVVMHRRNRCEWVVIQPLDDWIELYKEAQIPTCNMCYEAEALQGKTMCKECEEAERETK